MSLIYIVEDEENIREIETFALKNSGFEVQAYSCASDFYAGIGEKKPDLALLDVMLPDGDGLAIVKKLRERTDTARLPIIMVTAKTTELDKVKGLDQGADDYLAKPFGIMELISRVKALLRRTEREKERKCFRLGELLLDEERRGVYVNDIEIDLTYKEYELLKYMITNIGIVLSRDVLMEHVWGVEFEGESRTVDMHIKTLRQKLGKAGNHIKTVRSVGYRME